VCDLETSRMGAPYIYDISRLRVNQLRMLPKSVNSNNKKCANKLSCLIVSRCVLLEGITNYITKELSN